MDSSFEKPVMVLIPSTNAKIGILVTYPLLAIGLALFAYAVVDVWAINNNISWNNMGALSTWLMHSLKLAFEKPLGALGKLLIFGLIIFYLRMIMNVFKAGAGAFRKNPKIEIYEDRFLADGKIYFWKDYSECKIKYSGGRGPVVATLAVLVSKLDRNFEFSLIIYDKPEINSLIDFLRQKFSPYSSAR